MQFNINQLKLSPGSEVVLSDINWQEFEQLIADTTIHLPRLAYSDGVLKLMSPSMEHEYDKTLIANLIEALLDAFDFDFEGLGSVTLKHANQGKSVEPDECYYIHNAAQIRTKSEIDLRIDPPPDLVLEIDISSKTDLTIYQALGVPELWLYNATGLAIYRLEAAHYIKAETSSYFPIADLRNRLTSYVERSKTSGRRAIMLDFRAWLAQSDLGLVHLYQDSMR